MKPMLSKRPVRSPSRPGFRNKIRSAELAISSGPGSRRGNSRVRSTTAKPAEIEADDRAPEWVCAQRRDVLRHEPDGVLRLADRHITVEESVLRTQNLAIFL